MPPWPKSKLPRPAQPSNLYPNRAQVAADAPTRFRSREEERGRGRRGETGASAHRRPSRQRRLQRPSSCRGKAETHPEELERIGNGIKRLLHKSYRAEIKTESSPSMGFFEPKTVKREYTKHGSAQINNEFKAVQKVMNRMDVQGLRQQDMVIVKDVLSAKEAFRAAAHGEVHFSPDETSLKWAMKYADEDEKLFVRVARIAVKDTQFDSSEQIIPCSGSPWSCDGTHSRTCSPVCRSWLRCQRIRRVPPQRLSPPRRRLLKALTSRKRK